MEENQYYNKAVGRALQVMEWMARNGRGSLLDICQGLNLPKSSTYGIIQTLMDHGYVERATDGHFTLGLKVVNLGSSVLARLDIREWALPVMQRLVAATQETAHLGVMDRGMVVYIERVNSPLPVHVSYIGFRSPPTCSALGLALLSELSEDGLAQLARNGNLVQCTPETVADLDGLRPILARIRSQGYAVDDRTQDSQVRSVAAPVRNHNGVVIAALSLSGIVGRITDQRLALLTEQVCQAAMEISRAVGYPV